MFQFLQMQTDVNLEQNKMDIVGKRIAGIRILLALEIDIRVGKQTSDLFRASIIRKDQDPHY
jgi:hypothetical protein